MIEELKKAARDVSQNAYAPYSHFPVGAAILTGEDEIVTGVNVENASYGLTICAERNAVFQAVARGARRVKAVAIYTQTPEPRSPCGACRQVLNEFGPEADVYSICDGPRTTHFRLDALLPEAFGPHSL